MCSAKAKAQRRTSPSPAGCRLPPSPDSRKRPTAETPAAVHGWVTSDPELVWIGIDRDGKGDPVYSLGQGDRPPAGPEDERIKTQDELLKRLDARLAEKQGPVQINLRAHEELPSGVVLELRVELEKRRDKIVKVFDGVSEGTP